ncbi:DUF2493 domain-containing protein [bacterium]|nr:DUF2493 domain-containing protein [bacterium]
MKVIIAGSRSITRIELVEKAIRDSGFSISEVISGGARGVDKLAIEWAVQHKIRVKSFIPNWEKFGRSAGFRRNIEMAEYAEALIAVWDTISKGTKHMIETAQHHSLPCYVLQVVI